MGQLEEIAFENQSPQIKKHVVNYWTKRAESFFDLRKEELSSRKAVDWINEIENKLQGLISERGKNLSVLDVGCGAGFFEILLGNRGFIVTGIDLTLEMVVKANEMIKRSSRNPDNTKALQMDAEKLDFGDETFDVVISRNLTWNLPHPVDAYREWLRVLKKGGILLNFDAEYAKGAHNLKTPENMAHRNISDEMKDECHRMYHMLTVSTLNRPEWDCEVLSHLGYEKISADRDFGDRVYREIDEFYIPDRMFLICAGKPY